MAYPAAKSGFSLEDLTRMGPDEITRKRKIAEALLAQSQGVHPIANPLEGMAQMANALVGNLKLSRLDRAEREGKEGANALFSGGMGMGEFPPAPGGGSAAVSPNVADGSKGNEAYAAAGSSPDWKAIPASADSAELMAYLSDPAKRSTLPAGMRNNNPGNIKYVGQGRDKGVVGPSANTDQGDPQAVFDSPESGMREMYRLALRKYHGGKTTANSLIAGQGGWTPGNYQAAANVARAAGLSPDQDLGLTDPARAAKFLRGLIAQEHGKKGALYPDAMIQRALGVQQASAQPAPTQVASNDPSIGMPPAANAMLPPPQGAAGQEAIGKMLLGQTGYDPAANPANAQVDAMMANGGAGVPPQVAAVDPAQVPLPTPAAPGVVPPGVPVPQQQQMAQALIGQDPAATLGAPPISPQGPDMRTLMNMAGNEFMSPSQQKMIEALTGQRMKQADPANQLDMELKRAQLDAAKRPPKAWQKLDDDTLFDPISGETKQIGAGGPTKFEGTGLEAQAWNILQSADPSSREYATAYSIVSQPKTQLVQTENGMMPVEVPPQLPGWLKAPGDGPAAAPPAGQRPDLAAPPPDLAAPIAPDARGAFDAAAGAPASATGGGVIPGTQKAKTEAQGRNSTLTTVLESEIPTINENWGALSDPKGQLLTAILGSDMANPWQSEEYQRAFNAVQDSATNVLYSLSGASSNPGEAFKKGMAFMPKFGDKPGAIADKLNRFKAHVRGIAIQSGDPEMVKNVNKMLEGLTGKSSAAPTGADAEGWKELAPGVKIRPKGQ